MTSPVLVLSDALDEIAVAKATKDAKARAHMVEAQDRVVWAIYLISPGFLSPFDVVHLQERGMLA